MNIGIPMFLGILIAIVHNKSTVLSRIMLTLMLLLMKTDVINLLSTKDPTNKNGKV